MNVNTTEFCNMIDKKQDEIRRIQDKMKRTEVS